MNDYILKLISLADDSAQVTSVEIVDDTTKKVFIQKKHGHFICCPSCGQRMVSKGVRTREVNHPVMQDGFSVILVLRIHKWFCRTCRTYDHDRFNFIEDYKQNTSLVPVMIVNALRDITVTLTQLAARFNVSDTYVFYTFMQYVDFPRLPFTEIISVDEVHMKFDKQDLYALIIMDFETGTVLDILPNRHKDTMDEYFLHIPFAERKRVRFIISDMYSPYVNFVNSYFPNATSIIDSFHVVSLIIHKITIYINQVSRKYKERDKKRLQQKNEQHNTNYKTTRMSPEVTLLEHYRYFITKNHEDISYEAYFRHIKGKGGYWFAPAAKEKALFELDPHFEEIRNLKEEYIRFNNSFVNDTSGAEAELDRIIALYQSSSIYFFKEIASTLQRYKTPIIQSFTYIHDSRYKEHQLLLDTLSDENNLRRLSNGPIEGFNNHPKDLKRMSRGLTNFEYARARILWHNRKDANMRAVPKSRDEIHNPGKPRGSYNKNNK